MFKRTVLAFGLLSALMTATPAVAAGDASVVGTADGKVRGSVEAKVRSFQGIPYAAAPPG